MLQDRRSWVRFLMKSLYFSVYLILLTSIWPRSSTQPLRNELALRRRPSRNADNLTTFCGPIVRKIWNSRRLTTLWASKAFYRVSFTFISICNLHSIIFVILFLAVI
jgi:hypothetical protein